MWIRESGGNELRKSGCAKKLDVKRDEKQNRKLGGLIIIFV